MDFGLINKTDQLPAPGAAQTIPKVAPNPNATTAAPNPPSTRKLAAWKHTQRSCNVKRFNGVTNNSGQSGGMIYAPYTPLIQTALMDNNFYLEVEIGTEAIKDYGQRYPHGLLITKQCYNETIRALNSVAAGKCFAVQWRTINVECGVEYINFTIQKWKSNPLYLKLWACQGNGPLLLINNETLRFTCNFKIDESVQRNYQVDKIVTSLKKLGIEAKQPWQIKLKGSLTVKQNKIVKITRSIIPGLEWWIGDQKISF